MREKIHFLDSITSMQNHYPPYLGLSPQKKAKQSCISIKYKTFNSRFTERKLNNYYIFFFTYIAFIFNSVSDWHWIGLTDLNSEGVWIWNHSRTVNSLWDYFFKYEIESYDCVVMPSGKWNNWHCSTKFYFICEK